MTFYDQMFNTIKDLEEQAILSETEIEAECLCTIADAIEAAYGIPTKGTSERE